MEVFTAVTSIIAKSLLVGVVIYNFVKINQLNKDLTELTDIVESSLETTDKFIELGKIFNDRLDILEKEQP